MPPKTRKRPCPVTDTPPSEPQFHTSSRLTMPVPSDTLLFADLKSQNVLHQSILDTIVNDLKFTHMMPVQAATVQDLLHERNDCLVQARTGTGKTLGFLLPAIQSALDANRIGDGSIPCLILTPTRELALQIATEAESLTTRFSQFKVATAIGGTNKDRESKSLPCTILVATPGRLMDHMGDEHVRYLLRNLQTLVLDEADRMLDMGFLPSIKKILGQLPNKSQVPRHSMFFSATLGNQIETVAQAILNKDYKFISTIPKGEAQTHDRVPQFSITVPEAVDLAPALLSTMLNERGPKFKAIVFATSAYVAELYGHVLSKADLPPTSVLHSRLSQSKRTSITNTFRTAENAIVVATDVIARGMDFPGVTHVFQVGLPMDRESYIHRLGRTARAEADGRGILILSQPESFFLYQLKGINLKEYPSLPLARAAVDDAMITLEGKGKIYQSWLGYYKTSLKQLKWTPAELVRQANIYAVEGLGCPEVPGLERSTIGKMGLKGVPGLVVSANRERPIGQTKAGQPRQKVEKGRESGPKQSGWSQGDGRSSQSGQRQESGEKQNGYGRQSTRGGGQAGQTNRGGSQRRGTKRLAWDV